MSRNSPLLALFLAVLMIAAACGIDAVDIETGEATSQSGSGSTGDDFPDGPIPVEPDGGIGDGAGPIPGTEGDDLPDGPIPVEPDGGIGDGAEPLPGAESPEDTGTWHGAEVAETNCPGMEWMRVQASAFSFSVPADFVEADVQPIDSEVGVWGNGNGITVNFDYGWYSGSIAEAPGAENEPIDYSGIVGERTIIRGGSANQIGVYFGEVAVVDGQVDKLGLTVDFTDSNDEIIGRCIVRSISWG